MRKPHTGELLALDTRTVARVALAESPDTVPAHWSGAWRWTVGAERSAEVGMRVTLHAEHSIGELVLSYAAGARSVVQHIGMEATRCHLGGRRWWARCPACDRRIALLYGPELRCRACHGLAYRTAQLGRFDRLTARMRAIQGELDPSFEGPPWAHPAKPRGMHWETYWGKLAELDRIEERRTARVDAFLAALTGPYGARSGARPRVGR